MINVAQYFTQQKFSRGGTIMRVIIGVVLISIIFAYFGLDFRAVVASTPAQAVIDVIVSAANWVWHVVTAAVEIVIGWF